MNENDIMLLIGHVISKYQRDMCYLGNNEKCDIIVSMRNVIS